MRNKDQINFIKKHHSDTVQLNDAVSDEKVSFLLKYYHDSDNKIVKNTGPRILYVNEGDGVIDDIIESLREKFGNFKVRSAHYFEVENPHVLHIDDDFSYPNSYKAFTIPLWVNANDCNKIKLVMFDQYYYGGPVKFFKGDTSIEHTYYNTPLFDYSNIENLSKSVIPKPLKNALFTHLKESWLEGLSISNVIPWIIGSIIAFDSLRIHCSSDFRKVGINKKIGLSIFTEI